MRGERGHLHLRVAKKKAEELKKDAEAEAKPLLEDLGKKRDEVAKGLEELFALVAASGLASDDLDTNAWAVMAATSMSYPTPARLADVIITNQNTGTVTRTTHSNEAGNYVAAALPASTYTLKCQKQGFQSSVHSDLELNVRTEIRVDFALAVGMVSTEVTVTATSVHLQTENATVSQAVTANHVESLDINGRNFIQLATLVPGAVGQSLIGSLNQPVGVTAKEAIVTTFAFHHLPDFWKGVALSRMHGMLQPGGLLYIHDVILEPDHALENIEAFIEGL